MDAAASVTALARASRPGRPADERRLALSGLARSARPEAAMRRAAAHLAVSAASRGVRAHARRLLAQRPRPTVTFR